MKKEITDSEKLNLLDKLKSNYGKGWICRYSSSGNCDNVWKIKYEL